MQNNSAAQRREGPTPECRICWQTDGEMISPCKGSMQFVHRGCLQTWQAKTGNNQCKVCKTRTSVWECMEWVKFAIGIFILAILASCWFTNKVQFDASQPWYKDIAQQSSIQASAVYSFDLTPGQTYCLTMMIGTRLVFRGCVLVVNATETCRLIVDDVGRSYTLCHHYATYWSASGVPGEAELTTVYIRREPCSVRFILPVRRDSDVLQWANDFWSCIARKQPLEDGRQWMRDGRWKDDTGIHCEDDGWRWDLFPSSSQLVGRVVVAKRMSDAQMSFDDWMKATSSTSSTRGLTTRRE